MLLVSQEVGSCPLAAGSGYSLGRVTSTGPCGLPQEPRRCISDRSDAEDELGCDPISEAVRAERGNTDFGGSGNRPPREDPCNILST